MKVLHKRERGRECIFLEQLGFNNIKHKLWTKAKFHLGANYFEISETEVFPKAFEKSGCKKSSVFVIKKSLERYN